MLKKYSFTTLAILLAFSLLLLACSKDETDQDVKREQIKPLLIAAMNKQSDIQTYTFSGEAELYLDWPALTGRSQDPLTSSLTSILTNGKIVWQGVADEQAPRVEVDFTLTPHQFQGQFEVPALINNNKLYIQIPLLATVEDEFLTFDLEPSISNISFMTAMKHLAEAIDEEDYELTDSEDSSDITISLHISKDNIADIVAKLDLQLPAIINELEHQGIISEAQATAWREQRTNSEPIHVSPDQIDQPGIVSFTINEEGFIVRQSYQLYFANQSLQVTYELDQINEAVSFNQPIPEQTRSINDMFQFIK